MTSKNIINILEQDILEVHYNACHGEYSQKQLCVLTNLTTLSRQQIQRWLQNRKKKAAPIGHSYQIISPRKSVTRQRKMQLFPAKKKEIKTELEELETLATQRELNSGSEMPETSQFLVEMKQLESQKMQVKPSLFQLFGGDFQGQPRFERFFSPVYQRRN